MTLTDFTIEFSSNITDKDMENALFAEADSRLRQLAKEQHDLTSATITIRRPAENSTSNSYTTTVVIYARPGNFASTESSEAPELALKRAINAVVRQARQMRASQRRQWQRSRNNQAANDK